jgi:hypothetical protein
MPGKPTTTDGKDFRLSLHRSMTARASTILAPPEFNRCRNARGRTTE